MCWILKIRLTWLYVLGKELTLRMWSILSLVFSSSLAADWMCCSRTSSSLRERWIASSCGMDSNCTWGGPPPPPPPPGPPPPPPWKDGRRDLMGLMLPTVPPPPPPTPPPAPNTEPGRIDIRLRRRVVVTLLLLPPEVTSGGWGGARWFPAGGSPSKGGGGGSSPSSLSVVNKTIHSANTERKSRAGKTWKTGTGKQGINLLFWKGKGVGFQG